MAVVVDNVLSPRYRRKIFVPGVSQYAQNLLKGLDGLDSDIEVLKVNMPLDHVHMVVVIPPRVSVAGHHSIHQIAIRKIAEGEISFSRKCHVGQEWHLEPWPLRAHHRPE